MAFKKNVFFEHTTTLQFMKQIGEAFVELIDFDGIEDVSIVTATSPPILTIARRYQMPAP